jgi:acyl-[acyl carrier protein]--UDP-N-acetylglucosamine O-acyltransferase
VRKDGDFVTLGSACNEWKGTLAYADSAAYLRKLIGRTQVAAVMTREDLVAEFSEEMPPDWGIVVDAEPRERFFEFHEAFAESGGYGPRSEGRRGTSCKVASSARIAPDAVLGDGVEVGEQVVIGEGVEIGPGCILQPGVVVGCEGILYRRANGQVRFVRQCGRVVIGKAVVCLANSVVVRSVHPGYPTRLGDRSILGIGATVGHEAQVGADCVLSGQTIVARGTTMEDKSFLGPGAVVTENLRIGRGARVLAGSVVIQDVAEGGEVSGNFASPHRMRLMQHLKGLKP